MDGRQPTEREAAAAVGGPATSQGGVWIRLASSRSSRRTRASALSLVPVWPGGPCGCWPTPRCFQVGRSLGGAIGPNFGGTLGRCRTVPGSATSSEGPVRPGGSCWWWRLATYRLRGSRTALSGGRLTDARLREAAHHVSWRRAGMVGMSIGVVVFAGDDRRSSAFTPTQSTSHHRHPAARPPANPESAKHEHLGRVWPDGIW